MNIKENIAVIEMPLQGRDVKNNEDQLQIEDFRINIKEEIELYDKPIIFTRQIYNVKDKVTHTPERTYQCSCCDNAFILKHHLISHQRTHTWDKTFQCSQCDKAF